MELTPPIQLNGLLLQEELKTAGIKLNDYPRLNDGILSLNIAKADESKAKQIVEAHNGASYERDNALATASAKSALLERLGITAEEAALLLS